MRRAIYSLFLLVVLVLSSCNSGPVVTRATGFAYEIVVVMEQKFWESASGEAVNDQLLAPVRGLPQYEPSLKVSYTQPSSFNGLLTYVRNILIVDINPDIYTKISMTSENNKWAFGQLVITLKAPNPEEVISYLEKHPNQLSDIFVKEEMKRATSQIEETYSSVVMEHLKKNHNVELKAPEEMVYFKDTTDFFWATNNANTGRMDVVVYSFPYTDANTFTVDYLVAKRDSVMKNNLPGSFPNSYMATETKYFDVEYKALRVRNKYCGEMRGLWKMVGDMMGGPFVSHARLDEKNQRVIVAEGFVYAPETTKRNFIRRIESALYTLRLPGEFEEAEAETNKE